MEVEEVYDEDNKLLVLHYLYKSKGKQKKNLI